MVFVLSGVNPDAARLALVEQTVWAQTSNWTVAYYSVVGLAGAAVFHSLVVQSATVQVFPFAVAPFTAPGFVVLTCVVDSWRSSCLKLPANLLMTFLERPVFADGSLLAFALAAGQDWRCWLQHFGAGYLCSWDFVFRRQVFENHHLIAG